MGYPFVQALGISAGTYVYTTFKYVVCTTVKRHVVRHSTSLSKSIQFHTLATITNSVALRMLVRSSSNNAVFEFAAVNYSLGFSIVIHYGKERWKNSVIESQARVHVALRGI